MKKDTLINDYFTLVNFGIMPVYGRLAGDSENMENRQNGKRFPHTD
jgi:hypothetical protein